jgi:telomerase reverse transcriptase
MLQNVFQVLTLEKERCPNLLESGVMGQLDVYKRILGFKQELEGYPEQELYFCKVDIKACFDSIRQDVLLPILEDIIKEVHGLTR